MINAPLVGVLDGLLAVSYVMVHAVTRRINFALGAVSIVAAYTAANTALWLLIQYPGTPTFVVVSLAFTAAVAHVAILGFAIQHLLTEPLLRAQTLAAMTATIGLAIFLEDAVRLANDSRERWLPPLFPGTVQLGGTASFLVQVPAINLTVTGLGLALEGGLLLFMAYHPFGRAWRAVADDLGMAELCGIDVSRTVMLTMVLASAVAGVSGALLAVTYGVASYYGGFVIALKTLFVAVIGGINSIGGVLLAGLLLGVFEALWSGYAPIAYRDVAAFAALAIIMVLLPRGLGGR